MKSAKNLFLTDAQLRSELKRCEFCEEQPCRTGCLESEMNCSPGCPANVSPPDFIMAARGGRPSDFKRAAALIMAANPFGGVCGLVCPDRVCRFTCVHRDYDWPVQIPAIQATIIHRARELKVMPEWAKVKRNGKKVAVIGAGPAGLSGAALLARKGYEVDVFERSSRAGGMARAIPAYRLGRDMLEADIDFCLSLGAINLKLENEVSEPARLLEEGYQAVLVATGLWEPIKPGILNEDLAITAMEYLLHPEKYKLQGRVAVIGGGATATDCAVTAKKSGADYVEMFALESIGEMPLTAKEREELIENGIDVNGRTRVTALRAEGGKVAGLDLIKVTIPPDACFSLDCVEDLQGCHQVRLGVDHVIIAIGNRPESRRVEKAGVFYAGDAILGPSTVVEAVASGKNAAEAIEAYIGKKEAPERKEGAKSLALLPGYDFQPVSLETDFFGRKLINPFLLSAAPPSDGREQMKKGLEAGWAGGIMKTAFDPEVAIHIPAAYMYQFSPDSYGNCDNVSGHHLDRVCWEIEELVKLFPDRLIGASTGGNVTGDDESDSKSWQNNTRVLENAGTMVIEYSLSCPQGGEGAEGDIVSQNPELTAKIIDWILRVGRPEIPKLFKLTPAVTEITTIIKAVKAVFDRYPDHKTGVTLGNTFPSLDFRRLEKKEWEEGVVVGMSGRAIAPINFLTLAKVGNLDVHVSGNGGPMSYMDAANFFALGSKTVQFCTIVETFGYRIIEELCSGLSHLMADRGISSLKELIGIALPSPIRDFMELSPVKQISTVDEELCLHCGNCTRCPYLAISLNEKKIPETDPERCIGCQMCTFLCPSGALSLRDRTEEEAVALKED